MFFVGLVPAIYKEIAVIYKTLAKKSTREHTRGISKCSNGRPYKCLNHRIDPKAGIYLVFQEQNNKIYGPRQRPYGPHERAQEPTTSSGTLVVPPRAPHIFMWPLSFNNIDNNNKHHRPWWPFGTKPFWNGRRTKSEKTILRIRALYLRRTGADLSWASSRVSRERSWRTTLVRSTRPKIASLALPGAPYVTTNQVHTRDVEQTRRTTKFEMVLLL